MKLAKSVLIYLSLFIVNVFSYNILLSIRVLHSVEHEVNVTINFSQVSPKRATKIFIKEGTNSTWRCVFKRMQL
jgi:hypothetical protein